MKNKACLYVKYNLIHKFWILCYSFKLAWKIIKRGFLHDLSKFSGIEWKFFSRHSFENYPHVGYGETYLQHLQTTVKEAIDHHYELNDHHPEHYKNGIRDMKFDAFIEMYLDWLAATRANPHNTLSEVLKTNKDRFKIDDQLYEVMCNGICEDH
jgi:hypothetical protein